MDGIFTLLSIVPATYLMAAIGDRYGRKLGLLVMSAICVLCSMNIWMFILARVLAGVIMAGSCVTCPTYIRELSEDNIRGALGCWAIVLGVAQLSGPTLASGVVEKTGRRLLLFVSCIVSGLSMCLLATWFLLKYLNPPAWISLFSLCLCIFCDASGLVPVGVVIVGEIFSFKYRDTVLATTMAIASIADFIQLLFFKPLIKAVGFHVAFYFFGAMCLLTAVYDIIVIPETRNKKLEDIYNHLRTIKDKNEMKNQDAI